MLALGTKEAPVPVITTDILLEGVRRDAVFDWLGDVAHHRLILEGAFDGLSEIEPGRYKLVLRIPPRAHTMTYHFLERDDSHGGRRVLVETGGRRTTGKLHYSLRTMKPSTNTLVTLHMDYDPGRLIGAALDAVVLRKKLERCFDKVLENLSREIPREA